MSEFHAVVIEDHPHLSQAIAEVLNFHDWETEVVSDGGLALSRLEAAQPDVVLLDIHLPNVSGLDILDAIRDHEQLKKTFVVVLTADPLRAQDADAKADLVLIKPVSLQQLIQLVQRFLNYKN